MSEGLKNNAEKYKEVVPGFAHEKAGESIERLSDQPQVSQPDLNTSHIELAQSGLAEAGEVEGEHSTDEVNSETKAVLEKMSPFIAKEGPLGGVKHLLTEEADIIAGYPQGTIEAINKLRIEHRDEE